MMVRLIVWILLSIFCFQKINAQNSIPLDTLHWEINAQSYKLENYKGKDAIYIKQGLAFLKDTKFLNGTIEFDVYLTEQQGFPGIRFRATDRNNMESFYIRSHLSGKPDGNQVAPVINGSTPWQLYFGPKYSFIYNYNYDRWTHIKIVVNGQRAQVYLDNARTAHLSWKLIHEPKEGEIAIGGGGSAMYYANFKINKNEDQIIDFKPTERTAIEGLISEWEISDKFEEKRLEDLSIVNALIQSRKWGEKKIEVEEGTAANIARQVILRDVTPGNTVFAKITVDSDKDQIKLFEFGYSDRVVVILNNEAIYRGTNKWRSRDYRYLGTIGLFDAVYLNFKKGKNTLLLAVSEDFGGWLVTGRFPDLKEIKVE